MYVHTYVRVELSIFAGPSLVRRNPRTAVPAEISENTSPFVRLYRIAAGLPQKETKCLLLKLSYH